MATAQRNRTNFYYDRQFDFIREQYPEIETFSYVLFAELV